MIKKYPKLLAAICWMNFLANEVLLVNAEGKKSQALHISVHALAQSGIRQTQNFLMLSSIMQYRFIYVIWDAQKIDKKYFNLFCYFVQNVLSICDYLVFCPLYLYDFPTSVEKVKFKMLFSRAG